MGFADPRYTFIYNNGDLMKNYCDAERLILTDCDGVLLNYEYAFHTWMKNNGHVLINDAHLYDYDVLSCYGYKYEQSKHLFKTFNSSAAMGFLPPLRDAAYYVDLLHRKHGYVFHCITSMSRDENAQQLRIANLKKVFGGTAFERFVFLDTGEDKTKVLSEYKDSGLLWVEDKLENAVEGQRLGLQSILMEHGHNMIRSHKPRNDPMWLEATTIPRYTKWRDIYEVLT